MPGGVSGARSLSYLGDQQPVSAPLGEQAVADWLTHAGLDRSEQAVDDLGRELASQLGKVLSVPGHDFQLSNFGAQSGQASGRSSKPQWAEVGLPAAWILFWLTGVGYLVRQRMRQRLAESK